MRYVIRTPDFFYLATRISAVFTGEPYRWTAMRHAALEFPTREDAQIALDQVPQTDPRRETAEIIEA